MILIGTSPHRCGKFGRKFLKKVAERRRSTGKVRNSGMGKRVAKRYRERTVSWRKGDEVGDYGREADGAKRRGMTILQRIQSPLEVLWTIYYVEPCEDGRIHFLLGYSGNNKCPVPVYLGLLNIYGDV